jgi:hypothetical protein
VFAAIGLLEEPVAAIVGAMVIAALLGPNLALVFAATLGDHGGLPVAGCQDADLDRKMSRPAIGDLDGPVLGDNPGNVSA